MCICSQGRYLQIILRNHTLCEKEKQKEKEDTYRIYMITPKDQISHDLSYFSGPRTSGAGKGDGKYGKSNFGGYSVPGKENVLIRFE